MGWLGLGGLPESAAGVWVPENMSTSGDQDTLVRGAISVSGIAGGSQCLRRGSWLECDRENLCEGPQTVSLGSQGSGPLWTGGCCRV